MARTDHKLSTSTTQPYWFRFKFPPSAERWWRKRRELPDVPVDETAEVWTPIKVDQKLSVEHERVEFERIDPGRFAWIRSDIGTRVPCIAVNLDEMEPYEIEPLYEEARRKRDPSRSPHTALRILEYGNPADVFGFLEQFGPLWLPDDTELLPGGTSLSGAYLTAGLGDRCG